MYFLSKKMPSFPKPFLIYKYLMFLVSVLGAMAEEDSRGKVEEKLAWGGDGRGSGSWTQWPSARIEYVPQCSWHD